MSELHNVWIPWCLNHIMSEPHNVWIASCTNHTMHKSNLAQITSCTNHTMHKSPHAHITSCMNHVMWKSYYAWSRPSQMTCCFVDSAQIYSCSVVARWHCKMMEPNLHKECATRESQFRQPKHHPWCQRLILQHPFHWNKCNYGGPDKSKVEFQLKFTHT